MRVLMAVACCALLASGASGILYDVQLDTAQEVPAPSLGGATPSGTVTVDVNTITGGISFAGSYTGMSSPVRAAHLHGLVPAGAPAGVLVPMTQTGGTAGTLGGSGTLSPLNLTGLLKGLTYVNVHTNNNTPGEIRGQVVDPDILVFDLLLDAAQSVPPPVLGGATPTGTARVVLDTSSGAIEVSGTYTGMTSPVIAAHLHGLTGPSPTAGIILPFTTGQGTAGAFSGSGVLSAANLAGLLGGRTYINVHTNNNTPGEIRALVPEPASLASIAPLAAGLLFAPRRRPAA